MMSSLSISGRVLLLALTAPSLLAALDPTKPIHQYGHRSWTVEDGLPQTSVNDIVQTPDGSLWLATRGGLARWDGVSFEIFDRGNVEALASSSFWELAVDLDGDLWIGGDGGLVSYRDNVFTRWDERLGLTHKRVMSLSASKSGGVWFGTYGGGLGRLRDGDLKLWTKADGLLDNSAWALYEAPSGELWYAPYVGGAGRVGHDDVPSAGLDNSYGEVGTWAFLEDRDGRFWVGGNNGLHLLQGDSIRTFDRRHGLTSPFVTALLEDRDGNLWAGTEGGGLHRFSRQRESFEHFGTDEGLLGNHVSALFEDREGHLWIGTRSGGLDVLKDAIFTSLSLTRESGEERSSRDLPVTSVAEGKDGTIWVATHQDGVRAIRGNTSIERVSVEDGLPANRLWSILADSRSNLWIGTSGRGLVRLRDGEMRTFTTADGLPHDVVFGLYESRDGTLWIATNGGLGRLLQGKIDSLTEGDGLSSNLIRALAEDGDGNLWIGTAGGGLNRLSGAGEITRFGLREGLTNDTVWSLHVDDFGVVWAGTDGGLFRWRDGRFVGIDARHGLQYDSVNMIVTDDAGDLWIGTWRGIQQVRRRQLEDFFAGRIDAVVSLGYGQGDGVRNAECQGGVQPSAWRARDGRLWFPTIRGLTVVDPAVAEASVLAPPTTIRGLAFDGTSVGLGATVTVPPGVRRLDFQYTAISFRAPHRLRFRYRLEPFDGDWVDAGGRRQVSYTNVAPGSYLFQVAARNEDGDWGPETGFEIHVEPRFYETRPFIALVLVLPLALFFSAQQLRVRQLSRRKKELTERVNEALASVETLSGMLPICASCKKIRDDQGYWNQIESYIAERSQAEFSHGVCPDCYKVFMKEQFGEEVELHGGQS